MTDYRAQFDADVTFLNGGALQAQQFRLDLPDEQISETGIAELFVRHLGLLMVDRVTLTGLQLLAEPHKGSRGPSGSAAPAFDTQRRLVDINHVVRAGMTTYPGLPGPEITPHLTRESSRTVYAEGTEFAIDRISMVGNTGTYVDSPFHRYADGTDLADLPLESVADLPAKVVRFSGTTSPDIQPEALTAIEPAGCAVLLHTGWDRHWGTEAYGGRAPYLTGPAAQLLADRGARLVGIDSVNIDSADGGERPAHSILLGAGIPVLEHLTGLGEVPVNGARLHAAPVRVRGLGTFPVRAYAVIEGV